jgi:gas vesicle protein
MLMRFGFILGSVVGAAVTAYLMRDRTVTVKENVERLMRCTSEIMSAVADRMRTVNLSPSSHTSTSHPSTFTSSATDTSTATAEQKVDQWMNQIDENPEVRQQVKRIIRENQ